MTYTSDGGEVTLKLTEGSASFAVGDEFTFSTTKGVINGELLTLTETGADTSIFEGQMEMDTSGYVTPPQLTFSFWAKTSKAYIYSLHVIYLFSMSHTPGYFTK